MKAFVDNPSSQAIARTLNAANATVCEHGRNPCVIRCGVKDRSGTGGQWKPVPAEARQRWLDGILDSPGPGKFSGYCTTHPMMRYECGCPTPIKG